MARGGRRGFWRGVLAGLVLAAAAALALAVAFPPRPLLPPEISPGTLAVPPAPEPAPGRGAAGGRPGAGPAAGAAGTGRIAVADARRGGALTLDSA